MALVSFKKGLLANLPAQKTAGTFYVTTDERAIYLDVDGESRIRLGDFQEFASVAELTKNANPNTTALYYVSDINCLAKWNGEEYVQINKDTGMTSVEVTGDGNAVTVASYDAAGRKLTLTKGATYMTAADVDSKVKVVSDYVGSIPEGYEEQTNVIAYINKKAQEVLDSATGGSSESAASVKQALDAYKASNDPKVAANATAAAEAKTAAENAQAAADAAQNTANSKTTMAEVEAKGYATKTEAQGYANAKDTAIAEAKAAGEAAQSDVDTLKAKVGTVAEGKTVVKMIEEAQAAATYDDTKVKADIAANAETIGGVKGRLDTFLADADLTENAIDTLKELQTYITEHGTEAAGWTNKITANETAIAEEAKTARAAEEANATGVTEAKTAAATAQSDVDAIKADYLKSADKTTLQGNIDAVSSRVKTIEDKNVSDGATKVEKSDTNGNIKIDGVETVVYTHPAAHTISEVTGLQAALDAKATKTDLEATNANVTANAEAITALQTGKADKATTLAGYGITDAYKKTETYTQAEVDAKLTWGEF